jgi:hypothetical protein
LGKRNKPNDKKIKKNIGKGGKMKKLIQIKVTEQEELIINSCYEKVKTEQKKNFFLIQALLKGIKEEK